MHTGKASKIGAFLKLENLFKLVLEGGLEKEFRFAPLTLSNNYLIQPQPSRPH